MRAYPAKENMMADLTPCEELFNAIHAETDPTKKAALQADYAAHCGVNGDQQPVFSGPHGPPPGS